MWSQGGVGLFFFLGGRLLNGGALGGGGAFNFAFVGVRYRPLELLAFLHVIILSHIFNHFMTASLFLCVRLIFLSACTFPLALDFCVLTYFGWIFIPGVDDGEVEQLGPEYRLEHFGSLDQELR